MKKVLMILALSLPLMAQEAEAKESVGKKVVRTIQDVEWSKSKSAHQRDHDKKGGMKRGDMKRGDIRMKAQRKKMAKKQKIRRVVQLAIVGGIAYYVGYHEGEKHFKGGMKRRPPYMGDKK